MALLQEPWIRMFLLVWAVFIGCTIPLVILSFVRRAKGKDVRSMWVKYGAWFIMVPVVTLPMFLGRWGMQAAFLVLSLLAFEEFSRAVGIRDEPSRLWLARAAIVLIYLPVFASWYCLFMAMPAYLILLVLLLPILRDRYEGMVRRTCLTVLGVLYFGWFLAHLAYLMNTETGRELVLAFLLVVVMNDASAYLVGSSFGRHRLAPRLSPKKTIEGSVGALAVAMGVMFAVRFAFEGITLAHTIALGFLLAFGGTCGDLAISLIKRDVGIKDTGSLIPGHGGLLDRLDSILFAAPIFFHFLNHFYLHLYIPK